jgi:Skp family chaperone for outer membrane proteins
MDGLNKQIEDIQRKFQAGANTLSDEEKARLQRQGQLLQNQLKRASEQYDEQIQAAQTDIIDAIGKKMIDVLDSYSRENGLAVVMNIAPNSASVLYKAPQLDITMDIVKLYDQRYPIKATASAPAKPPATTPVKKPGGPGQQN